MLHQPSRSDANPKSRPLTGFTRMRWTRYGLETTVGEPDGRYLRKGKSETRPEVVDDVDNSSGTSRETPPGVPILV